MPCRRRTSFSVSAVVGSSMMMSCACEASARQIATSCFWATGRASTRVSRSISTPIFSSALRAIARDASRLKSSLWVESWVTKAIFSATLRFGNSEKSWKITITPAAAEMRGFKTGRAFPAICTVPSLVGSTPEMILMSVDFPDPFSPARQTASPRFKLKSTESSAVTPA